MSPDPHAAALRDLLAIVDIDASATLAVLALAQSELPRALAICDGDLIGARFRIADSWRDELAHCAATLNTRSVNRQALLRQGVAAALVDGFIGAGVQPRYAGESDPYLDVLRIDLGEVSALVNPRNQHCLLTAPDHYLIDQALAPPSWPRTPTSRPAFLRLTSPADLPDRIDATALRSLELACPMFAGLRDVLMAARELRRLCLHDASALGSAGFDGLEWPALERLELEDAARLDADGWSRACDWHAIRALRIHGLGLAHDNFDVLDLLGRAPWWQQLGELDLQLHTRYATLDDRRWSGLWADRTFALESLRLRFLDSLRWRAVWRGHFPQLRTLAMAGNALGDTLADALDGARLPQLETLDLRGNNLSPQAVRAFATAHSFPSLRRLGIKLASDVLEDYCDWNGAVVGSGPVPMSAKEIEATCLAGTGLKVFDD